MDIITVSQLNRYIAFKLKEDSNLRSLTIKGELSNFTFHRASGHFYFTLKDDKSSIKGVMFNNFASRVKFKPESGMSVIIQGSISVFERDGVYQVYATDMQPDGIGALYLAYEQLKEKLSSEGYFNDENKRQLPAIPKRIGVITSLEGAALQDIINILGRRYPIGELLVFGALVQGEYAPASIVSAISRAEARGCDVLIVGRGGGSFEDLNAFNHESVAMAVYNCSIPVISAVGHETDYTICDFVSDLRAPTPSAAAELVAPSREDLLGMIGFRQKMVYDRISTTVNNGSERLLRLGDRLSKYSADSILKEREERLSKLSQRLKGQGQLLIDRNERVLSDRALLLDSINPLKVLSRGYSVVYNKNDKVIVSAKQISVGECVSIHFKDAIVDAEIKKVT